MSTYTVNKKGLDTAVGFNNAAGVLSTREPEWDKLAEIAVYSKDQTLIGLFEKLPSIEEWDRLKAENFINNQTVADATQVAAKTTTTVKP